MDFRLNDEHQMVQETMRRIALERIQPRAAAIDESGEYPEDIYQVFRETGMLGVAIPEEYEGAGTGTLGLAIAVEEASKFCQASALILLLTKLSTASILYFGNEEQKRKYLTGTATGTLRGAFGLTEPGTGSDSANIRTTAKRDGDHYILNGTKHWISGATVADFFVVATKTDPTAGSKGFSVFIVDRDTPGFSVGKQERKMGVRGVPTAELIMQDARVPATNMVGLENQGFKVIMANLNSVRPVVAARGVGMAEGALQYATDYAKQRETFGKPIIEHQAIQFMLAETAMRAEASRLLDLSSGVDGGSRQLRQKERALPFDGKGVRYRNGGQGHRRLLAGVGQLRLQHGIPDGALLPRCQAIDDR